MTTLRDALADYLGSAAGSGSRCPRTAGCWKGSLSSASGPGREDHLRAGAEVGKAAGARAPAPLAPAALRRARVRAPSGDGRPRQRGSLHGPSACHPPADRAIHLPRRGDRGADGGRGRAPAAPARRSSSDADRAAGWACAPAKRSRSTAKTSTFAAAWCTSVRASRRGNARSRCTRARSARLASTPVTRRHCQLEVVWTFC